MTADNTQNGYVAEGTGLKTTLNRREYSVALTLYAWWLKIRLASCIFWSVLIVIGGNTQNGHVAEGTRNQTTLNHRGYSVALALYAWWLKIRLVSCIFWSDSILIRVNTQNGYVWWTFYVHRLTWQVDCNILLVVLLFRWVKLPNTAQLSSVSQEYYISTRILQMSSFIPIILPKQSHHRLKYNVRFGNSTTCNES